MSPTMQREAIEQWAKTNGVQIGEMHEDMTRSGGTMDRPGMNRALARVRAGKSSGLIVARLDRFSRTLSGGLATIEELRGLGARVVSVAESVDPETPMGRAMLGLLLVIAQWQRDMAEESFAASMVRAVAQKRYPTRTPYGYRRDEAGQIIVDDATAAVVRRIFSERAAGVGWRKIADDLTKDGIQTPFTGGSRWATSTLHSIIRSTSPLGVFTGPRGLHVEEAWEPIVERDLWERANAIRGTRDDARKYEDRLFAGIARCAGCRFVMVRQVNPNGFVSYGCPTRGCKGGGSLSAALLDAHVGEMVDQRLARIVLEPQVADDSERDRLTADRDRAVAELERWRDDAEMRSILGDHDYREGLISRARARDAAEEALREYTAVVGLPDLDLPEGVVPTLEALPWDVRRSVVDVLVHSVFVRRSQHKGPAATKRVGERLHVAFRDDAALPDLPRVGMRAPLPALTWD